MQYWTDIKFTSCISSLIVMYIGPWFFSKAYPKLSLKLVIKRTHTIKNLESLNTQHIFMKGIQCRWKWKKETSSLGKLTQCIIDIWRIQGPTRLWWRWISYARSLLFVKMDLSFLSIWQCNTCSFVLLAAKGDRASS